MYVGSLPPDPWHLNPDPFFMPTIADSLARMMGEFAKLPGIGPKSAERIAYYLLKIGKEEALALADSIRSVKENVRYCADCYHLTEQERCEICRDPRRDATLLCVVEQPRDVLAIEETGGYDGLYHVLLGRLSPTEKVGPDQLTIEPLVGRIRDGGFKELIMATNPTLDGDGTVIYILRRLKEAGLSIKVSRLARGVTTGSDLQFASKEMLSDAISGRQRLE